MDAFGINYPNWKEPWLTVEQKPFERTWWNIPDDYVLVNYTGRHIVNDQMKIKSRVNWARVVESIKKPIYFVGHESEYLNFVEHSTALPYLKTDNILQLSLLIKGAHSIYCNQSSTLAIAQSLGKTYYLDVKPMKTNCLLHTPNEHILL
jgi:hypothetical protein